MPDLLREQFPHFRPIVEAFGYRNLEFEGWEADDVIATLATRADEAGIRTCVVSTDRDAFQLVLRERLPDDDAARRRATSTSTRRSASRPATGSGPTRCPDFIGLKGDTSDNIPGVPGIGDKTAGQLDRAVRVARGRARARGGAVAGAPQEPDRVRRPGARVEGARDDAPRPRPRLRPGRARPRAARPRAAEARSFRRFEFRALLGAGGRARRGGARTRRGSRPGQRCLARGRRTRASTAMRRVSPRTSGRVAVALGDEVVVAPRPGAARGRRSSRTTRRRCGSRPPTTRCSSPT